MQWNCEGIHSKVTSGDAKQFIKDSGSSILVWQETKLPYDKFFKIKGFKSYLNNLKIEEGQKPHGGVGIFVKNFASSYEIKLNTNLQAIAVSVKIHARITICSIYLPPGEPVTLDELQNLINQLPKPFLLLGDFNAHHPMWYDSRETDERGKTIVDLIIQNDIALLDKNKNTHIWKVDKSFGHIDLSLCSTELIPWFQWDVHDDTLNSDHFPILLKTSTSDVDKRPEKWLLEKADWKQYQEHTITDKSIDDFNSINEAANFFETHIKEAASKFIPKTKGKVNTKSPVWWNNRCRSAIQKRKAACRRYTRVTSNRNYNAFSKARAEVKREVKKSKRQSWTNFINSINRNSKSRDVWKKILALNNKYKSEMVNTLALNNKEVKITNIPIPCKTKLIEELCNIGCVQTLNSEEEENTTTLYIRFEDNESTEKAIELNNCEIQAHKLKTELIHYTTDQQTILDDPKDIADCLGKRFAYVSSKHSGDSRFQDHKEQAEKENLDFSTNIKFSYNNDITSDELLYSLNLVTDSSPGPDEICYSMLKNLDPSGKDLLLDLLNCIFK